ncbi:hypothetical protein [Tautonia rosea]|uniref:hypothetical protein n=1 Tax=Tautonia rosea TaxID=2728037 RepID=UPI001472C45C|nr:hypothetical protein [Tautonia rosea]
MMLTLARRYVPLLVLASLIGHDQPLSAEDQGQTLWVEAERPSRSDMIRHPQWYDRVKSEELSSGDWLSHFSDDRPGTAEYDLDIPQAGRYAFWLRANPVQAALDYRLDEGDWQPVDFCQADQQVYLADDEKPDLRFVAWTRLDDLELSAGRHVLSFRTRSNLHHHGAIDAFVLTTEAFVPRGLDRPGASNLTVFGGAGTWPFRPEPDTFREDALLDLRSLNEEIAGQNGFVRRTDDGNGFLLGDGSPVRFWAVTTYVQRQGELEALKHHARFLAKRGVNMVRYHGHLEPKPEEHPEASLTDPDPEALDQAWKLVAGMKDSGIYTTLSPYWAANFKQVPARFGIEGWPEDQSPQGLLFFNPTLQQSYKSWLRKLLATPNPYTGIPLAEDPALAVIQLQNEDSMLFWTMQNVKGRQLELLGKQFGNWLVNKYGLLDSAIRAWDGDRMRDDDFDRGIVGIHIVWEWTQSRSGGRKARLDDQLQFFGETMYAFNQEIARYLRDELGCRQLINAGNWKTADPIRLEDVERWSYTANDIIAVNRYYSPVHLGPDRGWRINAGDRFANRSALLDPRSLPTNIKQVAGFPTMLTETKWVPPLTYQAEAPVLASVYSALTGIDGFIWFSTGETEWSLVDRAEWNAASRKKWEIATPMVLGQFPAAALIYRLGYVTEGEPVIIEHRTLDELWQREPPIIAEDPSYDPNRDLGDSARRVEQTGPDAVDPLAFLAGPVVVSYNSDPSRSEVADLDALIHRDLQRVGSVTGEVVVNFGQGLCGLNAPKAQGVVGFLDRVGTFTFRDVTISSQNSYGAVLAVSLDDQPLATSRSILVQLGTEALPTGWTTHPTTLSIDDGQREIDGFEIVETGRMPWAIARTKGSIRVQNPQLTSAVVLDPNGVPVRSLDVTTSDGSLNVDLPAEALYVVLQTD